MCVCVCVRVRVRVRACCQYIYNISLQNGTVPPPNQCSAAVQALYGPNDNCASAVRMELAANSDFDNIFDPMTAISGCPRRVTAVIRYCSFINDTLVGVAVILL